ncbi:MAG: hypothetical protein RR635_08355 [Oscillospiraceae bacterium]
MRKKLFTIALSAIMVIATATPAFAKAFYPVGSSGSYLNLYGNSGIQGRPLSLYSQSTGPDQQFETIYQIAPGTNSYAWYFINSNYPAYALNRRTNDARAIMWYLDKNSVYDSSLYNVTTYYPARIKLSNYNEYLCSIGNTSGSDVYFKSPSVYPLTEWNVTYD